MADNPLGSTIKEKGLSNHLWGGGRGLSQSVYTTMLR